ncbi:hypothetical protein [Aureimonas phyllosphaerae]|uniref:Uncharacterized protein n=1 Tax=Aureimonas phyllosphaerae TaxID=1166078 RepID=A0A7W6FWD0_9HYPH|nr:hypothetical protein [Aureimonas phyllosphaerae]MBB3938103.1 hypothetical protein [Aureimonas phyllosphaerae]MBB3962110.1 hypothetical protein [Aureimonas phyllosphaerae]SFF55924.1 hypothetical protein SAMN05216566_12817 [Aureimonas phyllosphaerae]
MSQNATVSPVSALSVASVSRGYYNEIESVVMSDGSTVSASTIIGMFTSVLPETFVEFDKKQRGDALNLDLYGYDPAQGVAVIQIRHAFRRYRNGYLNVHKDYVLVGQNEETREFFRHPIQAAAIHAGIRKDASAVSAVRAAQRWMWRVTDAQLSQGIRQGDILVVPCRKPSKVEPIEESVVVVADTHEVHGSAFARDAKGVIYAMGPTVRHNKGQHAAAFGDNDGWHSIRVGREAQTWKWGTRLGD